MTEHNDAFDGFHKRLTPNATMRKRIQGSVSHLTSFAQGHDDLGRMLAEAPFPQGSYSHNTLARPLDSGYDIDLTLPLTPDAVDDLGGDSDDVMAFVLDVLEDDDYYRPRLELLSRCVRVHYAKDDFGTFHTDVVPMTPSNRPNLWDLADGHGGWEVTGPKQTTAWVRDVNAECDGRFTRTVKFFKRWRDLNIPDANVPSVLLMTFAGTHHPFRNDVRRRQLGFRTRRYNTDCNFFTDTMMVMADCMRRHHDGFKLRNPVPPGDDVSRDMGPDDIHALRSALERDWAAAHKARSNPDSDGSLADWQKLLGDDFAP